MTARKRGDRSCSVCICTADIALSRNFSWTRLSWGKVRNGSGSSIHKHVPWNEVFIVILIFILFCSVFLEMFMAE
jgi:hypothetical protein